MSLDADIVIERRRLKRTVTLWRILAIVALAVTAAIVLSRNGQMGASLGLTPHVARLKIEGFITDNRPQQELLDKLSKSSTAKAVIVYINSPGGTTAGGEALYEGLRRIAEKKPTVAVFGTAATSAAYLAAIASDFIVARGSSITGSVGVLFQWADVSDLLNKLGVKFEEVKSGPLKAVPSPFKPTDEAARHITAELVNETQSWFLSLVKERRKLTPETLDDVKTGRIYTGRQAISAGLIDAIGDESTARTWLEDKNKIPRTMPVIDWEPEKSSAYSLLRLAGKAVAAFFGLETANLLTFFNENVPYAGQRLDGLISVWQLQKP